jgi:hypothetical protein
MEIWTPQTESEASSARETYLMKNWEMTAVISRQAATIAAQAQVLDGIAEMLGVEPGDVDAIGPAIERLKKDAAIGAAIQKACGELPEGFDLHLELERGAGTLRLYLIDADATIDEFDGDTLAEEIVSAIEEAKALAGGEAV